MARLSIFNMNYKAAAFAARKAFIAYKVAFEA